MRVLRGQRGDSKAGCLLWLAVAVLFGVVAAKAVPVKLASMQLEDYMKELAMTKPRATQDYFERRIFRKAEELRLDIPRKQIRVKKYPERVVMDVQFTVPIDILTFTYDWKLKIHVDRDIFLM